MPDQKNQNQTNQKQNKIIKFLLWITGAVLLVRFVSMGFNPMMDTTEARYSEIGRIMAETGNWITPMFDYGVPFWGKPPLSFWATAASFKLFGVSDFAAHLPHFLFMFGILVAMYFFVRRYFGRMMAAMSVTVLTTMTMFLYLMGGVMTDMSFALFAMLAFIGFYNCIVGAPPTALRAEPPRTRGGTTWGYIFFAALGGALLAKGPLVFALVGLPIFLFVLFTKKWRDVWRRLPWIGGILLMLAIALPWYILAERATPGFLYYFIVGEHFLRYLNPGWTGDLYGGGHAVFIGQFFFFWLAALLPWLIWVAWNFIRRASFRKLIVSREFVRNDFLFLMLLNIAVTVVFFSLARNLVATYVITTLPSSAILIAWLIGKNDGDTPHLSKFKWFAGFNIAIFAALIAVDASYPKWADDIGRTDKYTVETYIADRASSDVPLFYFQKKPTFSSRFYSHGNIARARSVAELRAAIAAHGTVFLLMPNSMKPNEYDFAPMKKTIIDHGKKTTLVKLESAN